MKTSYIFIASLLVSSGLLRAQDTSGFKPQSTSAPQMEIEKMGIQIQPDTTTMMTTMLDTQSLSLNNDACLFQEINDSLFSLIKTYDHRESILQKLLLHESAMSGREIMRDRLKLLAAILKSHSLNKEQLR